MTHEKLDTNALKGSLDTLKKEQYGVQVIWKDPEGAGLAKGEESKVHSFSTREQAEKFASYYDPELAPAQEAKEVKIFTREAIEIYSSWVPTEQ